MCMIKHVEISVVFPSNKLHFNEVKWQTKFVNKKKTFTFKGTAIFFIIMIRRGIYDCDITLIFAISKGNRFLKKRKTDTVIVKKIGPSNSE